MSAPLRPRLRIVTGKGGVGKTVVASALALAEAQKGRRVLVCEVHGKDRVAALYQVAPVGAKLREVIDNVSIVDMTPDEAIHEYVLLTLRFEALYRAVFENRLVKSFIRLIPSLGEMVMLGKVWFHERELVGDRPRFDVIILDAPATGHAMSLLRTPHVIQETVPGGPLYDHAKNIETLLRDPARTCMHVVTTPEEMPVNEAVELVRAAREQLGIRVGELVVNQRLTALPNGTLGELAILERDNHLASVHAGLAMREQKREAGETHLRRLPAEILRDAVSLPRIVRDSFGLAEVQELATRFLGVV